MGHDRRGFGGATRHRPTSLRHLGALLVLAGLLASACTGSSDRPESAPDSDPIEDVPETATDDGSASNVDDGQITLEQPPVPTVAFVSTDGSAFAGSLSVLRLREVDSGVEFSVPVTGEGPSTRLELVLEPGTYDIESVGRQVGPTASYEVTDINPSQIVVSDPGAGEAGDPVTVEFRLVAEVSPFDLTLDEVRADGVDLIWERHGEADIARYALAVTDGPEPAASPGDGRPVEIGPDATAVSVDSLQPGAEYTFTMFAEAGDGTPLEFRSVTVTTPAADGSQPAFALAPNTIVTTDFDALQARSVSPGRVQVVLADDAIDRSSTTEIPGIPTDAVTSGCVVGLPFIAPTAVAGENTFYGVVESCTAPPPALRSTPALGTAAVINTDVPLAAVVPYFRLVDSQVKRCVDEDGVELGAGAELCRPTDGGDADGDGIADSAERALGLDPADPSDDFDSWKASPVDGAVGESADPDELAPPSDLGSGEVQVTLLWSTPDDLDLHVTEPDGTRVFHGAKTSASGGQLDRDDPGSSECGAATTRAENVFWQAGAPSGTYQVRVVNDYDGGRPNCNQTVTARLQVRVDGAVIIDQSIEVSASEVESAPALAFDVVPELEILLTWDTPDDLVLVMAGVDPTGSSAGITVNADETSIGSTYETPGPDGGTIRVEGQVGDPSCSSTGPHRERIVLDGGTLPDWWYTVGIGTEEAGACSASHTARLEIRVRGQVVVDRQLELSTSDGIASPQRLIDFTVVGGVGVAGPPQQAAGFRSTAAGFAAPRSAMAKAPISCRTKKAAVLASDLSEFSPGFGFDPFHKVDISLKSGTLRWNIKAGLIAYIDPTIKIEGGVECSVDFEGATFQLTTTPVPVNLEIAPVLQGAATGSFELNGPRLVLTFGVETTGFVDASLDTCGWFEIPCGIDVEAGATAKPIGDFTVGPATMKVEGELAVGLGVEASLGVGVKNAFVTAKTGFAVTMQPIVGKVKASLSLTTPEVIDLTRATMPFDWTEWEERYPQWNGRPDVLTCPFKGKTTPILHWRDDDLICADAYCVEKFRLEFSGWGLTENSCRRLLCLSDGREYTLGTERFSCPMLAGPPEAEPASTGSANPFSLCAQFGLGAELSVDLRAETFVLGWGKDKRYPVWKGEYDYPNASFPIGSC